MEKATPAENARPQSRGEAIRSVLWPERFDLAVLHLRHPPRGGGILQSSSAPSLCGEAAILRASTDMNAALQRFTALNTACCAYDSIIDKGMQELFVEKYEKGEA